MSRRQAMSPAFGNLREAAGFALLMIALLALPSILFGGGLISRELLYRGIPDQGGPYSYFHHEIFEEKSDIDLLFLGSSLLWDGIDAPFVQKALSAKLGREAKVVCFGTTWRGEDVLYVLLRDLLARRRVKMLVIAMPTPGDVTNLPHVFAYRWLQADGEELSKGLPLRGKVQLAALQVYGAARPLVGILRSAPPAERNRYFDQLGSGFEVYAADKKVAAGSLTPPVLTSREITYSEEARGFFRFAGPPLLPYQKHFVGLTGHLVQKYGIKTLTLRIPVMSERIASVVDEAEDWSKYFGPGTRMLGIRPSRLFAGLNYDEFDSLYLNITHLNLSGASFFTRAITPALLEHYENLVDRS